MENDRTDDDTYLKLDDGTKYPYSGANHIVYDLDSNTDEHPELGEDYDLYLDPNGYVLAYSTDISKNFLYVEDSDEELVNWDANVVLDNGSDAAIDVDTDIKGIRGDENILYLNTNEITDKFNLNGGRDSLVWLDSMS